MSSKRYQHVALCFTFGCGVPHRVFNRGLFFGIHRFLRFASPYLIGFFNRGILHFASQVGLLPGDEGGGVEHLRLGQKLWRRLGSPWQELLGNQTNLTFAPAWKLLRPAGLGRLQQAPFIAGCRHSWALAGHFLWDKRRSTTEVAFPCKGGSEGTEHEQMRWLSFDKGSKPCVNLLYKPPVHGRRRQMGSCGSCVGSCLWTKGCPLL